jgi:hypothetical protein
MDGPLGTAPDRSSLVLPAGRGRLSPRSAGLSRPLTVADILNIGCCSGLTVERDGCGGCGSPRSGDRRAATLSGGGRERKRHQGLIARAARPSPPASKTGGCSGMRACVHANPCLSISLQGALLRTLPEEGPPDSEIGGQMMIYRARHDKILAKQSLGDV